MLIEARVIDHLKTKFGTQDVYAEVPEVAPDSFVLVLVTDRRQNNLIDSATIEIHSFAPTKAEASALDKSVRQALESLPEHNDVSSCRIGGGDDEPSEWLKKYRYRSYFNVVFYDD